MALWFNQSAKNPKTRDWLRNRDFRQALSLAIDRDEINEIVFLGQGKPWQIGQSNGTSVRPNFLVAIS